jgi:hypothetical protein
LTQCPPREFAHIDNGSDLFEFHHPLSTTALTVALAPALEKADTPEEAALPAILTPEPAERKIVNISHCRSTCHCVEVWAKLTCSVSNGIDAVGDAIL